MKGKVSDSKNIVTALVYFCSYPYGTPCMIWSAGPKSNCVIKISTKFFQVPDQDSEWEDKLREVRNHLCELLPLNKAAELFELYSCHVNARKGTKHDSIEARAYRKLLELEEAILLWEELQVSDRSKLGNDPEKSFCTSSYATSNEVAKETV